MAKAYFIGGTPRTGKTTLTMKFLESQPVLAASTDAIRYMLRLTLDAEAFPDLFHLGKYTSNDPHKRAQLNDRPEEVIEIQIKESLIVWNAAVAFVQSNLEDGFDVLIEGIAVMPNLLKDVGFEYSAVFLGNQSDQHAQTILSSAINNPNDWMHDLDDETILAFASFNKAFSNHVQKEATDHGMTYVEIRDDNFQEDIAAALAVLQS